MCTCCTRVWVTDADLVLERDKGRQRSTTAAKRLHPHDLYHAAAMNPYQRQPDREEMHAMLKANAFVLAVYFAAIRATPLVSLLHACLCTYSIVSTSDTNALSMRLLALL